MEIRTDTLHYKLYALTYRSFDSLPPDKTNLCQYLIYSHD